MSTKHPFNLLREGGTAVFEGSTLSGDRFRATILRVLPGTLVVAHLPRPVPAGLVPGIGFIRIGVPVGRDLWSFSATIRGTTPVHDGIVLALSWPTHVEKRRGRQAPRVPLALPVRLRARTGDADWVATRTLDLSSTGLRCVAPGEYLGETLDVEIRTAGARIRAEAEVAWQRRPASATEYHLGVRFRSLTESGRRHLDALLEASTTRAA